MVESLEPGAQVDISIDMTSPSVIGIHQGQWRMQTPTGLYFGGEDAHFLHDRIKTLLVLSGFITAQMAC